MRYKRTPEHDCRISHGDDFGGDAWLDTESGEIVYAVCGYDMNRLEADTKESAEAQPQIAIWSISLDCYCPSCRKRVDLLDYADFWSGRRLDVGEHGTERSKGVMVVCPDCNHDFKVDLDIDC